MSRTGERAAAITLAVALALGGCDDGATEGPAVAAESVDWSQVNYLWEIHVHNLAADEDPLVFGSIRECLLELGQLLADHDVKVSWGIMEHFALAAQQHETTSDNVFLRLQEMGHEIGNHSLGYEQDATDVLTEHFGFQMLFNSPGIITTDTFEGQVAIIEDLVAGQGYSIFSDHFGWSDFAGGHDDADLIYAWQPSLDPVARDFSQLDPESSLLAVNQQGGGWVGANDVDIVAPVHFSNLEQHSPMSHFIDNAAEGRPTVYPVAVHEDLFTTGPAMREALQVLLDSGGTANWDQICLRDDCVFLDDECSQEALTALEDYLTESIDPLMASGAIVSRTYGEIYELYFSSAVSR